MTFLYYLIILMIMLIYIPIPLLNYTAIHTFQHNKLLCLCNAPDSFVYNAV